MSNPTATQHDHVVAWALAVFRTGPDGRRRGALITHDYQPAKPKKDGKPGVTFWEYEIDGLGYESMCYSLGEPDGPDGLYVFDCVGGSYDPGDGWETDPSLELDGAWRPLRLSEWEQIIKDPNLEAFCALDESGERIEWEHPDSEAIRPDDEYLLDEAGAGST